jgi:hypothetical protein
MRATTARAIEALDREQASAEAAESLLLARRVRKVRRLLRLQNDLDRVRRAVENNSAAIERIRLAIKAEQQRVAEGRP